MNKYILFYVKFLDYCMYDFLGGPKIIQIRWIVNFFKILTIIYIISLMFIFQNFAFGSYFYLALHGSYGIIWFIKDLTFPDINFQKYTTFPSAVGGSGVLIAYWIIPLIQIAGFGQNQIENIEVFKITTLYILGLVLMMGSDCQKYYTLKLKSGLISEGFFKLNRNPNYTGEIMIYLAFAKISNHPFSYLIVIMSWMFMFLPFMLRKEISFTTKKGFEDYKKNSYLFGWKFSNSHIVNILINLIIIAIFC